MTQQTPGLQALHAKLAPLASRYIDVSSLPWQPTRFPGIDIKVLMEDPDTGVQTVLTRMAPGSVLTEHMHMEIEQSWVLEGPWRADPRWCADCRNWLPIDSPLFRKADRLARIECNRSLQSDLSPCRPTLRSTGRARTRLLVGQHRRGAPVTLIVRHLGEAYPGQGASST